MKMCKSEDWRTATALVLVSLKPLYSYQSLTNEAGVVLGAAAQDLNDALNLLLATNAGIKLALRGEDRGGSGIRQGYIHMGGGGVETGLGQNDHMTAPASIPLASMHPCPHLKRLLSEIGAILGQSGHLIGCAWGGAAAHTCAHRLLGLTDHADNLCEGEAGKTRVRQWIQEQQGEWNIPKTVLSLWLVNP